MFVQQQGVRENAAKAVSSVHLLEHRCLAGDDGRLRIDQGDEGVSGPALVMLRAHGDRLG